ncbi:MAG TPA: hypothetical protein VI318_21335 [Baekduia sp.]
MAEPHRVVDLQQRGGGRRRQRARVDAQQLGRTPDQRRVAARVGGSQRDQPARRVRQRADAAQVALLDVAGERAGRGRQHVAARALRRAHAAGQLQQRERVAARLGDDPVADAVVERARRGVGDEGARVRVLQAADCELRKAVVGPPVAGLTQREDDRHGLGQQPSRDEPERLPRGGVQPLSVVDQAEERTILGDRAEQAQHGQGHQEPVRRGAGRDAHRDVQRVALRLRQPVEPVQQRRAQPLDPGERQLHLGLDAVEPRDAQPRGLPRGVAQQRRLPDARLAPDDQDGAPACARLREHPVEDLPLAGPAQEGEPVAEGHERV